MPVDTFNKNVVWHGRHPKQACRPCPVALQWLPTAWAVWAQSRAENEVACTNTKPSRPPDIAEKSLTYSGIMQQAWPEPYKYQECHSSVDLGCHSRYTYSCAASPHSVCVCESYIGKPIGTRAHSGHPYLAALQRCNHNMQELGLLSC